MSLWSVRANRAAVRRTAWWAAAVAVGLPGLLCGCLLLGPMASALLAAVSAGLALTAAVGRGPRAGPPVAVAAVAAAVVPLAVIGLLALAGVAALLLLGVLAAAWPGRGRRWRTLPAAVVRWLAGSPPEGSSVPADPLPPSSAVGGLGTDRICRVWQDSYLRLQACPRPAEREHLAELRRCLAEELERRDPGAFRRWLPTARAGGDPGRFFLRDRPRAG
jgi:hypothetical protein